LGTALIKDVKSSCCVEVNGILYRPNSIQALIINGLTKKAHQNEQNRKNK